MIKKKLSLHFKTIYIKSEKQLISIFIEWNVDPNFQK